MMHIVTPATFDDIASLVEAERRATQENPTPPKTAPQFRAARTKRVATWTERLAPWGLTYRDGLVPRTLEGLSQGRSWGGRARPCVVVIPRASGRPFTIRSTHPRVQRPGAVFDHPLAWRRGRYPALLVGEPYNIGGVPDLLRLTEDLGGLVCRIGGVSPYNPGHTYVVELWNAAVFGEKLADAA